MASPKTRDEVIAISNRVADEWGIPRLLLLACGVAESNLRWDARRPASPTDDERFWPDVSGGVWQQTVRYDPEYTAGGGYPGPSEIARILERQYDVERSAHVAAANLKQKLSLERGDPLTAATDDEILRTCYRFNWPAGGGRPYSPAHEENYRRGLAEAKEILGAKPMPLAYNPDQPPERQIQDWVCSIRAATWVLKSLGVNVDAGQMQAEMVPKYVTPADGLLDGKGYGLAEVLRRHLPAGTRVEVIERATWDDLVSRAGRGPIALGLHGAYHWINVARVKGAQLDAPNPAPNYPASAPIGDQLTQDEFNAFGPASLVFVDVGAGAVADPRDARIAQLEAEKAQLVTVIGYLTGDVARAIEAANNELKRHAPAA